MPKLIEMIDRLEKTFHFASYFELFLLSRLARVDARAPDLGNPRFATCSDARAQLIEYGE